MKENILPLTEAGLSELEAKIYIIILSKGAVNGSEIAEVLGIDRTIAYRGLRRLLAKKLILSTNENYDRKYYIEDTSKLVSLVEREINSKQVKLNNLKEFIRSIPFVSFDDLLKSKVKIYRGEDAIERIYEDRLLSENDVIREMSTDTVFPGLSKSYWNSLIKKRKELGLFLHQLVDSKDMSTEFHRSNKDQFKEVRVVPSDFVMSSGINIYGNKVAFHNGKVSDPLAMIIEDTHLATSIRNIFDFVWNRSKVI